MTWHVSALLQEAPACRKRWRAPSKQNNNGNHQQRFRFALTPFSSLPEETQVQRLAIRLAAGFTAIAAAALGFDAAAQTPQPTLPSTNTAAIATYESAGLYWQSPGGTSGCEVKFRKNGDSAWTAGLSMWYDARDG